MPVNNHIAQLIIKHLQDNITVEEELDLQRWIASDPQHRELFDRFTQHEVLQREMAAFSESNNRIQDQVYAQLPEVQEAIGNTSTAAPKRNWMRWASIAAAVLILGVLGLWYMLPKRTASTTVPEQQAPVANIIPAGGNKATLTLADGTVIDLDKAGNGEIAKQGKTSVNKKEDGQLEYRSAKGNGQHAIAYNLLSTPRGGQYQLLLPDGSKVWLNAASSIRYPTAFAGNERRVEVTGETYFEIVKNASKPFKVTIVPASGAADGTNAGRGGEVEVLGTHFNINAYGDEQPIVTTLLEGKIKVTPVELVSKPAASTSPSTTHRTYKTLSPGEEARINDKADVVVRKNVDTESAVAWMKGFFDFHQANIKTVMKQISRWYNVDVQYTAAVPAQTFEGSLDRNIPLNELLALLQQMGTTKFQIEGRTIMVK
ncbi:FecR family protein [Longitalea arenae]|uniref:FecR family protein n=1 Tax=Longitalea arenae TaxID=2812558 RepID=UPI0019672F82|nr:FecR family protein [Longitalea arenae]